MALSVKTDSWTTPYEQGATIARTGYGFQPKALIVLRAQSVVDSDTVNSGAALDIGIAASTSQRRFMRINAPDGAGNSTANSYLGNSFLAYPNTTTNLGYDLQSFDSGGFTIIQDAATFSTHVVKSIAFGGSDIANTFVGDGASPLATGDQTISGVGFQPDFVFIVALSTTSAWNPGATLSVCGISIGAACAGSPIQQQCHSHFDLNGAGSMDTASHFPSGKVMCIPASSTTDAAVCTVSSFNSDGFVLNWSAVSGSNAYKFMFLAIKGGAWWVKSGATTADTNNYSYTDSGFQLLGAMILGGNAGTGVGYNTDLAASIGVFDGTTQYISMAMSEDGVANSDTYSYSNSGYAFGDTDGTTSWARRGQVVSLNSNGITLKMTTANATLRSLIIVGAGNNLAAPASFVIPRKSRTYLRR